MIKHLYEQILKNTIGQESCWFWAMVQGVVVTVTLYLIYRQLVCQCNANMLSTIAGFDDAWKSKEMRNARKGLCQKLNTTNVKISEQDGVVLDFFEKMGLYLKLKVFSRDVVWNLHSYYIMHYWRIAEPSIKEYRSVTKDESWYESFEWLYAQMLKETQKKGLPANEKTRQEMEHFIKGENEKV